MKASKLAVRPGLSVLGNKWERKMLSLHVCVAGRDRIRGETIALGRQTIPCDVAQSPYPNQGHQSRTSQGGG